MPTHNPNRRRVGDPEYRREKALAPAPPEGYSTKAFTVCLPDTVNERAFFLGALTQLTKWTEYQRTHDQSAKAYADFWKAILEPAIRDFHDDQTPECLDCSEQEDTKADDLFSFIDGVVSSFQEGGIVKALGYAVDNLGEVIINTAVRIVSFTVIGYLTAGLFDIFVGGILQATIAIPEGKIIQVAWDTLTTNAKDVRGVLRVA